MAQPKSEPTTARAGATVGRPPVISLPEMLDAARAVAEDVGIESLTMGLVAERLGVSAAALYHYVPNKEALVTLVIDQAFERIEPPPVDSGPWDVRLRLFERAVRTELRRLKWRTPKIIDGEPPKSFHRLFSIGRDILRESGADERNLTLAYTTVYAFMIGQLWFDSATGASPEAEVKVEVVPEDLSIDSDDIFEHGIEVVIAGLKARLERKRRRRS